MMSKLDRRKANKKRISVIQAMIKSQNLCIHFQREWNQKIAKKKLKYKTKGCPNGKIRGREQLLPNVQKAPSFQSMSSVQNGTVTPGPA